MHPELASRQAQSIFGGTQRQEAEGFFSMACPACGHRSGGQITNGRHHYASWSCRNKLCRMGLRMTQHYNEDGEKTGADVWRAFLRSVKVRVSERDKTRPAPAPAPEAPPPAAAIPAAPTSPPQHPIRWEDYRL